MAQQGLHEKEAADEENITCYMARYDDIKNVQ